MTIRGLIFDLDGVIADTHEFHYRSWKRLADEEGLPFTRDDNEAMRGLTRKASLHRLLGQRIVSSAEAQTLMERKNRYFQESLSGIQPMPGVLNFMAEARAAGLRLGVGSASRNARLVLDSLKLTDKFDVIGDGHTVSHYKPAPDIFLWVAGALGLSPFEILVLEDSDVGVEAGLRGGFYVVRVNTADTANQAHLVLSSLADITLSELLAKIEAR